MSAKKKNPKMQLKCKMLGLFSIIFLLVNFTIIVNCQKISMKKLNKNWVICKIKYQNQLKKLNTFFKRCKIWLEMKCKVSTFTPNQNIYN
jgi:hypothetical protein